MNTTQEKILKVKNGWGMLAFTILLLLISVVMIFVPVVGVRVAGSLRTPGARLFFFGHFTLQPNEAMVLLLFGDYRGTEERNGFFFQSRNGLCQCIASPATESADGIVSCQMLMRPSGNAPAYLATSLMRPM